MSVTDNAREKLLIIDWVLRQEKSVNLKTISELIDRLDKESAESVRIAGYRARGISVSMSQMVESIRISIEEIRNGECISLEQLEHESDQW